MSVVDSSTARGWSCGRSFGGGDGVPSALPGSRGNLVSRVVRIVRLATARQRTVRRLTSGAGSRNALPLSMPFGPSQTRPGTFAGTTLQCPRRHENESRERNVSRKGTRLPRRASLMQFASNCTRSASQPMYGVLERNVVRVALRRYKHRAVGRRRPSFGDAGGLRREVSPKRSKTNQHFIEG